MCERNKIKSCVMSLSCVIVNRTFSEYQFEDTSSLTNVPANF